MPGWLQSPGIGRESLFPEESRGLHRETCGNIDNSAVIRAQAGLHAAPPRKTRLVQNLLSVMGLGSVAHPEGRKTGVPSTHDKLLLILLRSADETMPGVTGSILPLQIPPPRAVGRRPARAVRLLALGCTLWAAGCGMPQPQGGGQGPGHRQQQLAMSPAQELEVGRRAYREVLEKYRGKILSPDEPDAVRVRRVCNNIIRATGIRPLQREINLHLDRYHFDWEVHVVRSRQPNAFCLPGGKIVVFTAILPVAKNDDQLATVLSHEIAHALAHHASERIARAQREGKGILATLANLRHNREQELEADHIGVFLMPFAGYNPEEAVRFWERMQQATGQGRELPGFLSDHPSDSERIQKMRQWAPWATKAKRAYDEGRVVQDGTR
jgi:metalloendopeptidase OMA1, mitochondrial